MQGVVFNGHYLTYCDVCVTEYWRAIGVLPDRTSTRAARTRSCARPRSSTWRRPATTTNSRSAGASPRSDARSLRFDVEIFPRDGADILVHAELVYVNVDLKSARATEWPSVFRERVRAYEITAPEEAHGAR